MDNQQANSDKKEIQTSFSHRFFNVFQHSGDSIFLFPLFLFLFLLNSGQAKLLAVLVLAGMSITALVVFTLKQIFRKERPAGTAGKMYRKYDRFSFPSGHAARVCVIVVIMAFFYWPLAAGLSIWAVLIAYSRLKLKLHDVTDVFTGVAIGVAIGFFTVWMNKLFGLL
ncbi:MAG TPA: hypothetical protein DER09_00705 [Prolixibacteraceae bacterium]|nr:hypothetical protein [Prolixibacteraceae bacterium]